MHVGWDLLFLAPGASGGRETYARELLRELRALRGDLRITTFVNRDTAAAGPGFWSEPADRVVVLPRVTPERRAAWAAGEIAALPRAAARAGVDVLHAPANFGPWSGPFARVLTVHDVLWRVLPELQPRAVTLSTDALIRPAARRAHAVITVSDASRRALVRELGVREERVAVVPNGVVLPAPGAGDGARARARLGLGGRALALAVGSALPHKNLPALLDGLAAMPAAERPLLALAGHGTDGEALRGHARELGVEDDVALLGAVGADELEDLYAAAAVLVTTTLHEGFGLPVLEAMARGVPVAATDLPVLREVAGNDAVWLDPQRPETIAGALRRVLGDPALAETLRARGRKRVAGFSWRAAAEATARCYERALASRTRR